MEINTIFKGFIGKHLVRQSSMLRCLRIISDSQPKQIRPQSRRASAHISNTRHAVFPPLLMFLLDSLPHLLFVHLQGIALLFLSLLFITRSSSLCMDVHLDECIYLFSFSSLCAYCGSLMVGLLPLWVDRIMDGQECLWKREKEERLNELGWNIHCFTVNRKLICGCILTAITLMWHKCVL